MEGKTIVVDKEISFLSSGVYYTISVREYKNKKLVKEEVIHKAKDLDYEQEQEFNKKYEELIEKYDDELLSYYRERGYETTDLDSDGERKAIKNGEEVIIREYEKNDYTTLKEEHTYFYFY